jgi:hypothetical protein
MLEAERTSALEFMQAVSRDDGFETVGRNAHL